MTRRPNFFIVGAPKCGTTAMFDYLGRHPEVFVPRRKEPAYFGRDLDTGTFADMRYFTRDRASYLELFADARDERRLGEATVWYLYSDTAPREILEFAPDARVVIMLRQPVEMLHSLHAQRLVSGAEHIESFAEALAAEPARAQGEQLGRYAFVVKGLRYREIARYSRYVARYLETFGAERVLVLLFEDFVRDTAGVYAQTCRFLGIDDSFRPEFERVNPNTIVRSRRVRDVLQFHSSPVTRALSRAAPLPLRRAVRRIRGALLELNTKAMPREQLDPTLREQLERELAPDVAVLSELLSRNLISLWGLPRPRRDASA